MSETTLGQQRSGVPAGYPAQWEADVVLRDGAVAHLRPIVPADADAIQRMHQSQSQNSVYLRFFTFKSSLSDKELRRFTEVDYFDRVALVITLGSEVIGIGRFDRLKDPSWAEVAFNISDAHQGRGLGSILLEHLGVIAMEVGIRRFEAEVLPENRKMLTVFADAGYEVSRRFDDGVVSLSFDIDQTERSREVRDAREHRAESSSLRGVVYPETVLLISSSKKIDSTALRTLISNLRLNPGNEESTLVEAGRSGVRHPGAPRCSWLTLEDFRSDEDGAPADPGSPTQRGEEYERPLLAILAVDYVDIDDAVDCASSLGAHAAVIVTTGFTDDPDVGAERARDIVARARSTGMRILGPASLGIINGAVRLNASILPTVRAHSTGRSDSDVEGDNDGLQMGSNVGVFTQSAALGTSVYAAMLRRNLDARQFISAGHRADISGNDVMQFWEDEADVEVACLYLESMGNARKFTRIARRLARLKPVVLARSQALGRQLPPGHVARTSQAPAAALEAIFRQAGVIQVETIPELLDVAQLCSSQPLPRGGNVAFLSNSRALTQLLTDAAQDYGLCVTRSEPRALPPGVAGADGLAMLLQAHREASADPNVDAVVVCLLADTAVSVGELGAALAHAAAIEGKTTLLCLSGLLSTEARTDQLLSQGAGSKQPEISGSLRSVPLQSVPSYSSTSAALAALRHVVDYVHWREQEAEVPMPPDGIDRRAASKLVDEARLLVHGSELHELASEEVTKLLRCYGISVLDSATVTTADEASAAAWKLGWPVALKSTHRSLKQRLDLGGVRLNITDEAMLRADFAQMSTQLAGYYEPGDTPEFDVQSMAPLGQATVLQAVEDPLLGPIVSFGLSGDPTQLLDDWVHRAAPLSPLDAYAMIREPKAAAKLFGYEGLPQSRLDTLIDVLIRLAVLKDDLAHVVRLELNPVLAGAKSTSVLAARAWIGNPEQRMDSARRALNK